VARTRHPTSSIDRLLMDALSRKPDHRPDSVLDLIHAFQAIETELGVAQTPIEVAMDDWAHATVSDLDDRTQIRVVASDTPGAAGRRRRSHSAASASSVNQAAMRTAATRSAPARRVTAMTLALMVSAVAVLALGATAAVVLVRAASPGIPVVSDVSAHVSPDDTGGTVQFSWRDPGVRAGDVYTISTGGAQSSFQRSTDFVVDADPGSRVCVTVTVNREGKAGEPSGEKCVDVPE
jgi:hypothetical protein